MSFEHRSCSSADTAFQFLAARKTVVGPVLAVCALRIVSRPVSDLSCAGNGDGLAARPHLPDRSGGRGATGAKRFVCYAYRSLPGLPELPDSVPIGCSVWQPAWSRLASQIAENYQRPWLATKVRQHFYAEVLPSFGRLARHARLLRFYQRSGLQSLARATGILKLLGMAELDVLSPRIDSKFSFADLGRVFPAEGERRGRVALLIGCVASVAFAELNRATIRVLTKNGIEVHVPEKQSCCGALQLHAGLLDLARDAGATQHRCHAQSGVRRHRDQRRGMRIDAEGIRCAAARGSYLRRLGHRNLLRKCGTSTSIWRKLACESRRTN